MEGKTYNLLKLWGSVVPLLSYCYIIGKFVPKGLPRLLLTLPVVCIFFLIPLSIKSVTLAGIVGFALAWLGNFKLLLFAFGRGPLAMEGPSNSLLLFVTIAFFPIKPQKALPHNGSIDKSRPGAEKLQKGHRTILNFAVKVALLAAMIRLYDFTDRINRNITYLLYGFHSYFVLKTTLAISAAAVRAVLPTELEPQFNEPHLSTSLQDFWGRRWNLMVPSLLHPSVYEPVRNTSARMVGRRWAPLPAVLAAFLVSGLMHELMFYYLQEPARRAAPTWDITRFFLFHGACLVAELAAKKVVARRWRLPTMVSRALTGGLMIGTGVGWFQPLLLRMEVDKRSLEEYSVVAAFLKDAARIVSSKVLNMTDNRD